MQGSLYTKEVDRLVNVGSYRTLTTKKKGVIFLDEAGFIVGLLIISIGILLSYILEKRHVLGKKQES
jgi:hypothetical protein